MTKAIDPDLLDCLRREDSYTEVAVELSAPDVGLVLRRATDQFCTAPPLVSPVPLTAMAQAARGGLELTPTPATLATAAGSNTGVFDLNTEDPTTRMKGVLWSVGAQFARARLRSFSATIQRDPVWGTKNDFSLQIYRITKTPGVMQKYNAGTNSFTQDAFVDYAFTPLLSTAAVLKDASITYVGFQATLTFDLSNFGIVLENTPTPASSAGQVGELPVYLFVLSALGLGKTTGRFHWMTDTSGAKNLGSTIGTFQRSWWDRNSADAQWNRTDYNDCPSFALVIDTYPASASAVYALDLGRAPSAGTTGRVVLEQVLPPGTAATLELSTAGNAGPWTVVKNGDVVALAQQTYWQRLTLASDVAGRASPTVLGFGVEFRTPYDVSDIAAIALPARDIAPPDCKASIADATVRLIREGERDYLDLATTLGSTAPTSKLEADLYLRSRHPLILGDRSKWLRLERLTVSDRDPGATSETLSLLSIAKKLKVKIPAKIETVNTVHTVQAGTTTTAIKVSPVLVGTSVGGHEYNNLGYYLRVRASSASVPVGMTVPIAGSSGTGQLDIAAGVFSVPLNAGDVVEVHSGILQTAPLKWQNADPADVWYQILTAAAFPSDRIGSGDLPRAGFPPRVTDFEPGDAATQAKRLVTMSLTEEESADELLDQISFILGGATVERNGQICFVQVYPGRAASGAITVPVAPVAAVFDARDLVAGSLQTKPQVASRKPVVNATYGVNKAAANPDAYPVRSTSAVDVDAVTWLTQQDLELVGTMDLDEKITRWLYNTTDAGLYLASAVTAQVVRACSTGVRRFPFRVREPYPEVTLGDSAVVITDQYTDYDPSLSAAIAGTVALRGVVVHTGDGGREFAIFVLGLSDNAQQIAGGKAAALPGLGVPSIPRPPVVTVQPIGADGVVNLYVDGAAGVDVTQVVVRTDRAPTVDEILRSPYKTRSGVLNDLVPNVATIAPHTTYWVGSISTSLAGIPSAPEIFSAEWLGIGATPLPGVSAGAPVVQSGKITWPVTLSATCTRITAFRAYAANDPSPGTNVGVDLESRSSEVWDYFEVGENGVRAGVPFPIALPLYNDNHWGLLTLVPTDALHVRGPSLNLKAQGPGGAAPTAPGKPTLAASSATANAISATATLPSSGGAIAKLRPYADRKPLADVATSAGAGGTQALTYNGFPPGTSHVLQVSGVTATGVEGPLSDPITASTTGDTSTGTPGTGDNGKVPTPVITSASYSIPDQSAILPYAFNYPAPANTMVEFECSADGVSGWVVQAPLASASPGVIYQPQQSGADTTLYYRARASSGSYTPSDYSNVVAVTAPAGSGLIY